MCVSYPTNICRRPEKGHRRTSASGDDQCQKRREERASRGSPIHVLRERDPNVEWRMLNVESVLSKLRRKLENGRPPSSAFGTFSPTAVGEKASKSVGSYDRNGDSFAFFPPPRGEGAGGG